MKKSQSNTGVILIHGFTGSPNDLVDLENYLANQGFVVSVPTLPGHGSNPEDLRSVRKEDWLNTVLDEFDAFYPTVSKVFVVGMSFGANLAFSLAKRRSVDGIISLSAPAKINHQLSIKVALTLLKPFIKNYYKAKRGKGANEDIPGFTQTAYEWIPLSSLGEFIGFIESETTSQTLSSISSPCYIIQAEHDPVSVSWSPNFIHDHLNSDDKEVMIWQDKYHLIIQGERKLELYQRIGDWIKERA